MDAPDDNEQPHESVTHMCTCACRQGLVCRQTRATSPITDLTQRSRLSRLLDSLFYFIVSRSELLCYSAMVINHLTSGALLSLPLPLSIFLWAMLSSRPSRNYWITVLTYTEAMIVVKYIFQFRFYPWNADSPDTRPLAAVNIIGIDQKENAASAADLFLLLSLFLHRSILKVKRCPIGSSSANRQRTCCSLVLATWPLESRTNNNDRYCSFIGSGPVTFRHEQRFDRILLELIDASSSQSTREQPTTTASASSDLTPVQR
jgi:hypothetical protein